MADSDDTLDMPDELEGKLDAISADGQGPEKRDGRADAEPFLAPLGGIAQTGDGPDLQEPAANA